MLDHRRREITAHAVSRRLFARNHREAARLSLVVEIFNKLLKLTRWQPVEGVECDGGAARLLRG